MKLKTLPVLIALAVLTACGFQPMYGSHAPSASASSSSISGAPETLLSQIDIPVIETRESEDARYGQFLRNELVDRFHAQGAGTPRYTLSFSPLYMYIRELDLTKSAEATRAQLTVNVDFSLTDRQTGQAVLSRSITSVASYNILESRFATRVTEQNARENALRDTARQVEAQIALYFNR